MTGVVVDSCGWIESIQGGRLAHVYQPLVDRPEDVLVPTIVVYEVLRWADRERGAAAADALFARLARSRVLPLTTNVAVDAARLAPRWRLHMADAIILAHAREAAATLVTSDAAFARVPRVAFHAK